MGNHEAIKKTPFPVILQERVFSFEWEVVSTSQKPRYPWF